MTCDAITTFAFDSHPRCYTEGPSICFLPVTDIANVLATIDGQDLLSLRSAKQMASVAATCVEQLSATILPFDAPAGLRDPVARGDRLAFWREMLAQSTQSSAGGNSTL
jgi:hypothetical protein